MTTAILLIGAMIVIMTVRTAFGAKKPYKDLDAAKIVSATVRLTPPDKTVEITDIPELVSYLKDVVIYRKDNSYTECEGQGVTYMLTFSDGTQTEIMAYNPFLVIDGVGYQTKYAPCEALNRYANRLLNNENATIILEEPPYLTVMCDDTGMEAILGTYSWQKKNPDGTSTGIEADSAHPLDCEDRFLKFETTEDKAILEFGENPDAILNIRCWSEAHWGDSAADSEEVVIDGYEIELKPGGYIYEVAARWDSEKSGCGGTAYYSFYIKVLE